MHQQQHKICIPNNLLAEFKKNSLPAAAAAAAAAANIKEERNRNTLHQKNGRQTHIQHKNGLYNDVNILERSFRQKIKTSFSLVLDSAYVCTIN